MSAPVVIPPVAAPAVPVYANHLEFFDELLCHLFARDPEAEPGWCPEWPEHPAAEQGVDALWRSWESCRLDPGTGLAVWWTHYAHPMMRELFDPEGPFKGCAMTSDGREHCPVVRPL